jgi:hypothetical protein
MADSQFQTDRVGIVYVQRLALQLKSEFIESEMRGQFQTPGAVPPVLP